MAFHTAYDALDDAALLAAVLAREPAAWPTLFARYERLIGACIRRVLHRFQARHGADDVEEILSQTALLLIQDDYRKLRAFDPRRGCKLSTWLGLIASHAAHDALRRRGPLASEARVSLDGAPESIDSIRELRALIDPGPSPEAALARREELRQLERALAELGATDRLFAHYYFAEELPPEEIARLMDISLATVYSRKHKLREKLQRLLGEGGEPGGATVGPGKERAGSA